jgi:hypothetical protein
MVSSHVDDGDRGITRELSDELSRYVERHPDLRDDFILVARQDDAGDLVIVTVADIADDDATEMVSDGAPGGDGSADG